MGQVFTDKVDVTKLKEGMRLKVYTRHDSFTGVAFFDDDLDDKAWGIRGEEDGLFWACYSNGDFCVCVDSVEIINADPAEKTQAENAEMLEMLDDAAHALTCTDMILQRDVAQDAKALVAKIAKRKDAQ